jgi:uncharacterized protein (TIGR03067 family)
MLRYSLSLAALLGLCVASLAIADDKNAKGDEHKATITKVDAKAGTVTVKMKDKDGKDVERTFKLTEDIRYFDSTGKAVRIDVFESGNDVLVLEREGQLKQLRQNNAANAGTEQDRLVGNWTTVSGQEDGKALPAEKVKGSRVVIAKDHMTVHEENNQKRVLTYKLNAGATPRQIDMTTTEGSDKGKTSLGIYSLQGETLKICFAQPGQDRPKDFTTKEGSKSMMFVLKRADR